MPDSRPDAAFWKRKLAAYLHDPPSKCLDIRTHADRSEKSMQAAGLGTPEERSSWERASDRTAAAADRFPFPHHNESKLSCAFDGVRNRFRHPLGGGNVLSFEGPFISGEEGFEAEQTTQPVLNDLTNLPEAEQWRARFLAHWRLWSGASTRKDWRLAYLPADTRIPDHSIWTHMQMVSALDGCRSIDGKLRPAFLKFQLGPVQDFVQAARSTRDLWSGSYLLSWLMAHGLARLSLELGPDAVIFPNLKDQALVDLAMKGDIWDRVKIGNQSVWDSHDSLKWSRDELLTPNLPNVFLAIVPADLARDLAVAVEKAIQAEWRRIAESVWADCDSKGWWRRDDGLQPYPQRHARFDHQIDTFLSLSWSVTEWPDTLEQIEALGKSLPDPETGRRYQTVKAAAEAIRDLGHDDGRYFDEDGKLKNSGIAWALLSAISSWHLDAVRQTRAFAANPTDSVPSHQHTKDSLTGKEEAIAGGPAWRDDARFKHDGDYLAAPTLVKRLWDSTYLHKAWKDALGSKPRTMPNTRSLAAHDRHADDADDDSSADAGERYFAVLAFDGDDMGKWISGEKAPPFASQLADYEGGGALEYFQRPEHAEQFETFLNTPRPISPGYHLQFSECLSNFALRCVRPIVEAHDGRLIYAGGDDVVALLPADTALACANDLQLAFRGEEPIHLDSGIRQKAPGFLTVDSYHESTGKLDPAYEARIPFLVPGASATASVGIAIAHFKSPLQDAVRAAQAAEKRAKKLRGKSAVAVAVMKRSGETVEWSARWDDAGVWAASTLLEALQGGVVSAKFPYRLGELIAVYRTKSTGLMRATDAVEDFDLSAVFGHELRTVLGRQRGPAWSEKGAAFEESFTESMSDWIESLLKDSDPLDYGSAKLLDHAISQILALCAYCGFAKRQGTDATNEKQSAS